ncbi:MAG: hypothetical protein ACTSW1_07875 [Candidatus Hodarchaeales archaeon]
MINWEDYIKTETLEDKRITAKNLALYEHEDCVNAFEDWRIKKDLHGVDEYYLAVLEALRVCKEMAWSQVRALDRSEKISLKSFKPDIPKLNQDFTP